jgi:exodeoxyribonuclease III
LNDYFLSTWNVNGFRSSWGKGLQNYIKELKENNKNFILGLQEIKVLAEQLDSDILNSEEFSLVLNSATKKGYSGVAFVMSKNLAKNGEIILNLPSDFCSDPLYNEEGRVISFIHPHFIVINAYYPNGQRDHGRVDFKLQFTKDILNYGRFLHQEKKRPVFYCGDFNTAHKEIDLSHPKQNAKTTGFLPIERQLLDSMVEEWQLVDLFRHSYPDLKDAYTWWTYRQNCRERNIGWRLDYFWCHQENLTSSFKKVDTKQRPDVMGSDHCPVECHFHI